MRQSESESAYRLTRLGLRGPDE